MTTILEVKVTATTSKLETTGRTQRTVSCSRGMNNKNLFSICTWDNTKLCTFKGLLVNSSCESHVKPMIQVSF